MKKKRSKSINKKTSRRQRANLKYRSRKRLPSDLKKAYEPFMDRRRFIPVQIAYDDLGNQVEYELKEPQKRSKKKRDSTKWRIGPKNPLRTMICKRRSRRRRTLFAIKRIGKGRSGPKKRKMNPFSFMRC